MIFDRNENKEVIALLGAGSMGLAIARRFAAGRKILLGGRTEKKLEQTAQELRYSGYDAEIFVVDATKKEQVEAFAQKAASLGDVKYFTSPSEAAFCAKASTCSFFVASTTKISAS